MSSHPPEALEFVLQEPQLLPLCLHGRTLVICPKHQTQRSISLDLVILVVRQGLPTPVLAKSLSEADKEGNFTFT